MKDRRYTRLQVGEEQRQQAIQLGKGAVNAPWFADTISALSAWFVALAQRITEWPEDGSVIELDDGLKGLLSYIDDMAPDVAERILHWRPWHSHDQEDPEAAWAWGTGLAAAAAQLTEQPAAISYVWQQIAYDPVSQQAFLAGICVALASQGGADIRSFLRSVSAAVRDVTGCRFFRMSREAVVAEGALWWEHATLHNSWDESVRDYFVANCPNAGLLQALRNHDKKEYMLELEETRNPCLVADLFTYIDVLDEDEMLGLLAAAPTVYSPPTIAAPLCTWTGKITAPLLLDAIVNHIARLAHLIAISVQVSDVEVERERLFRTELPVLCDRIVETLLVRDDGVFLAAHFLAHIMHRLELLHVRGPLPAILYVCEAFAASLATHGITIDQLRMAWPYEAPDAVSVATKNRELLPGRLPSIHAIDVILAMVAVSGASGNTGDIAALLPTFSKSLLERDPGVVAIRHPLPSPRHSFAANLFLFTPDPAQAWATLWETLAEQRLRSLHSRYTLDHMAEDPSIFLLNVGMSALSPLCASDDEAAIEAMHLWEAVYNATLAVVIRQQRPQLEDHWRVAATNLFSYLPVVLRRQPMSLVTTDRIASEVSRLGTDDELLINCAAALYWNGVDTHDVMAAFTRANVALADLIARHDVYADTELRVPRNMPEAPIDIVRRIVAEAE